MRKLLLFLMCAGIAAAAAADSSVERVRRQFIEYYAMRELPMPQAEKYLAEKQLQTLCRAVEKAYGLKSLELSVRYPEEELPHMDFRDLAQVFIRAFSPSAAILAGAQYTVEDNTVTIHLRANGKDSILQNAKKGDLVVCMSCGDLYKAADMMVEK